MPELLATGEKEKEETPGQTEEETPTITGLPELTNIVELTEPIEKKPLKKNSIKNTTLFFLPSMLRAVTLRGLGGGTNLQHCGLLGILKSPQKILKNRFIAT